MIWAESNLPDALARGSLYTRCSEQPAALFPYLLAGISTHRNNGVPNAVSAIVPTVPALSHFYIAQDRAYISVGYRADDYSSELRSISGSFISFPQTKEVANGMVPNHPFISVPQSRAVHRRHIYARRIFPCAPDELLAVWTLNNGVRGFTSDSPSSLQKMTY